MTRGTFANIRLKNLLAPGTEGGVTRLLVDGSTVGSQQSAGSIIPIYDAAQIYKQQGIPLIVFAYFVPTLLSNTGVLPLESAAYFR